MSAFKETISSIEPFSKGGYCARLAQTPEDLCKALQLRNEMFVGHNTNNPTADADNFDPLCKHFIIEDAKTTELQACFRILHFDTGTSVCESYSAQFYGLNRLSSFPQPLIEIGRFCTAPYATDPNILRLCWSVLTRYVEMHNIGMMFGCCSFPGNEVAPFSEPLALLKDRHLAPKKWAPGVKFAEIDAYAIRLASYKPTLRPAIAMMPSLLRTYLSMGGWVSDHVVIYRNLNTFHVFTCVETAKIPARRVKLLRANSR